ncbi:MAG: hypothetical protein ACRDV2_13730, partial [Actinomycetes bacterium]
MQGTTIGARHVSAVVLGVLAITMTACASDEPADVTVKLEMSVQADENAKARTGTLTCPGETAKERD